MASKEELEELENLTNELTTSLTGYQTEISFLKGKIEELQQKEKETEDKLKKIQEANDNKQKELDQQKNSTANIIKKLKEAKEEKIKLDAQIEVVKDLFK